MNTPPPSIPSITSLYHCDFTIQRAANTMGFCLLAAVGFHWMSQPVPAVVKVENSPFETWVLQWGPTVALIIAALAMIVLVRRYLWVKEVLCQGTSIKGIVEEVDVYSHEASHSDSTPAFQRAINRSYYACIRYVWQGVGKKVRLKLPHPPSTYQATKGQEIELLVLDSAPQKPLIRAVYLWRSFAEQRRHRP
jgi:hypothetical protein